MQQKIKWALVAVCAVALCAWRAVDLTVFTQPATGFYALGQNWLWVVCAGCILVALALGIFLAKTEKGAPKTLPAGGWLVPAVAFAAAAACVYEAYGILFLGQGFGVQLVFTLLAAIFFLCCGVFHGQNSAMPLIVRFFSLPLAVLRLMGEFLYTKGMAITAEHVYRLLIYSFVLIAYVALARVLCLVDLQKSARRLLCWGTASALLAIGFALPAYGLAALRGLSALHGGSLPSLVNLFMGVFPFVYAVAFFWLPAKTVAAPADAPIEPQTPVCTEQPQASSEQEFQE